MKKIILFLMVLAISLSLAVSSSAAFITIDGITYKSYTGWATSKSTGNKSYYKDGKRVTGVQLLNGVRYVFDEKGVYLLKRDNAKEKYSVIFKDNYDVSLEDGKISFEVKVNDTNGIKMNDTWADPYFSLSVYKDGKWKKLSYKNTVFPAYALVALEGLFRFSGNTSSFDYNFEPGLYRVEALVSDGKRDKDNKMIETKVYGEFNLV